MHVDTSMQMHSPLSCYSCISRPLNPASCTCLMQFKDLTELKEMLELKEVRRVSGKREVGRDEWWQGGAIYNAAPGEEAPS